MDNVALVVGLVSGVLSIISFLLPINSMTARVWHASYILLVGAAVSFSTYQSSKLARLNDVSRSADALVANRQMNYTHRGFVLASMSFLEKNKDLFPDSYARAIQLCESFRCGDPNSSVEMVDAAFAFAGLVRGIGTLSKD